MYTYIWIEGEKNLDEFCLKRFGEKPKFIETIGHITAKGVTVKAHMTEKEDADGRYRKMYFLFMEHENGKYTYYQLDEIKHKATYEEIKADRTAVLRR